MEERKNTKGVWEVRVKETRAGQSAGAGHDKCAPLTFEGASHCDEQKTDKKEE